MADDDKPRYKSLPNTGPKSASGLNGDKAAFKKNETNLNDGDEAKIAAPKPKFDVVLNYKKRRSGGPDQLDDISALSSADPPGDDNPAISDNDQEQVIENEPELDPEQIAQAHKSAVGATYLASQPKKPLGAQNTVPKLNNIQLDGDNLKSEAPLEEDYNFPDELDVNGEDEDLAEPGQTHKAKEPAAISESQPILDRSAKNRPTYNIPRKGGETREPVRGAFSDLDKENPSLDEQGQKDYDKRRKENLSRSLIRGTGEGLRGVGKGFKVAQEQFRAKRDANAGNASSVASGVRAGFAAARQSAKQGGKTAAKSVYRTVLRAGSDKAFYYVLGSVAVPPFITGVIGLDILWGLSKVFGVSLKLWQKLVIVLLNLALALIVLIIFLAAMIHFCNVTIPLGSKIAKGLGYIGVSDKYAFCRHFDLSDWAGIGSSSGTSNARGGNSGGAGATDSFNPSPAPSGNPGNQLTFFPWTGTDIFPAASFGEGDPNLPPDNRTRLADLKTAIDALQQRWQSLGNPALVLRQVYRPQVYQMHIRSLLEVYRSSIGQPTRNSTDYGCDGWQSLPNDVWQRMTEEQRTAASQEFRKHAFTGSAYQIACFSDHAIGSAVDFGLSGINSQKFRELQSEANNVGLCNNVVNDPAHFALKKYLGPNPNCFNNSL